MSRARLLNDAKPSKVQPRCKAFSACRGALSLIHDAPRCQSAECIDSGQAAVLDYMSFPAAHRPQIPTTNPLERRPAAVQRRTDVVGFLPNAAAVQRLGGA